MDQAEDQSSSSHLGAECSPSKLLTTEPEDDPDNVVYLKSKLTEMEKQLHHVIESNTKLDAEVTQLKSKLSELPEENARLHSRVSSKIISNLTRTYNFTHVFLHMLHSWSHLIT